MGSDDVAPPILATSTFAVWYFVDSGDVNHLGVGHEIIGSLRNQNRAQKAALGREEEV